MLVTNESIALNREIIAGSPGCSQGGNYDVLERRCNRHAETRGLSAIFTRNSIKGFKWDLVRRSIEI